MPRTLVHLQSLPGVLMFILVEGAAPFYDDVSDSSLITR